MFVKQLKQACMIRTDAESACAVWVYDDGFCLSFEMTLSITDPGVQRFFTHLYLPNVVYIALESYTLQQAVCSSFRSVLQVYNGLYIQEE